MKIGIYGAIVAAAMTLPVLAQAAEGSYTATLAKAAGAPQEIITGSVVWHCQDSACVTTGAAHADSVWTCHQLADQVGQITAYGSASRSFDADRLAECNAQ